MKRPEGYDGTRMTRVPAAMQICADFFLFLYRNAIKLQFGEANNKDPRQFALPQASASSVCHSQPSVILSALIYLAVGTLLYHNVFFTWFLSDDLVIFNLISFNPFGYVEGGFFRPLTDFTNWLTFQVFGFNALPYKVTNLLIHIANSYLVMWIAAAILNKANFLGEKSFYSWLPFLAGLAFLVWPIRSESVFWGAGRASTLSFFFFAISYLGYFRYRNDGGLLVLGGALFSYLMGLFCYESVFSVPLVVLSTEVWIRYEEGKENGRTEKRTWWPVAGFFAVFTAYFGIRYGITGQVLGGYGDNFHAKLNLNILRNIFVYPFKMMIGAGFYSKQVFIILAGILTVIFGVLKVFYFRKTNWEIPSLWFFLIGTMYIASLPVLNLSMSISDTQFDRYLYLPSLFMLIMLTTFIAAFIENEKKALLTLILIGCYAGITTIIQSTHWQKASQQVRQTLSTINDLEKTDGRLIILNLPDHYCGAYLLRNGIHEGIKFLCPDTKFRSIHLIGMHPVCDLKSKVVVDRSGQKMQVSLPNASNEFSFEEKSSQLFEVISQTVGKFEITFQNLSPKDVIVYWSEGNIHELEMQ